MVNWPTWTNVVLFKTAMLNFYNFVIYFLVVNLVLPLENSGIGLSPVLGLMEQDKHVFPNALFNEARIEDFIENDVFFEITHPKELQYTYRLHQATNFGASFTRSLRDVRLVIADPLECCSYPSNAYLFKGAVALVSRGHCSFVSKTLKAEQAGAVAVVIMDNNIENDDMYIQMIHDKTNRNPEIPALFLLGMSGHIIQTKLKERQEDAAIINIPVNMSSVPIHKLNQPPWLVW